MNNSNQDKYLIIGSQDTTKEDCQKIIERLCKENPNVTIGEFLEEHYGMLILN